MQYTSKIALLAVALFGTSALAAPYAGDVEYDIEAREVDNDLAAREFYDVYMEARSNPSLDARDLEYMDLEAREYLDYLKAREVAAQAAEVHAAEPPQTPSSETPPQSPLPESHVESKEQGSAGPGSSEHEHLFLTKHQKHERHLRKLAAEKFQDPDVYHHALLDKEDKLHHFAVVRYLKKPKHLKKALADLESPYHKAAKRIVHKHKAKAYLAEKANFKKALKDKSNKFHKDAVRRYLKHGDHFKVALSDEKAPFHKAAVHEYLLDKKTRKAVLADKTSPYYKAAVKLQKKISKRRAESSSGSSSAAGSPPTTVGFSLFGVTAGSPSTPPAETKETTANAPAAPPTKA